MATRRWSVQSPLTCLLFESIIMYSFAVIVAAAGATMGSTLRTQAPLTTTLPAHTTSSGGRRQNTYVAKLGDMCRPGCWGSGVCDCNPMSCACGGECNWDCTVLPPNATKKNGVVECAVGFESLGSNTVACVPKTTATTTFTPGVKVTPPPRTTIPPTEKISGGRRLNTYVAKLGDVCRDGCWGLDVCHCNPMTCACGAADCDWDCTVLPANTTKKNGVVEWL